MGTFKPLISPDDIFLALLQRGLEIILGPLCVVRDMLSLLTLGMIYTKAGKKELVHPKFFRPIGLTSCVLKTVETVLDDYIGN